MPALRHADRAVLLVGDQGARRRTIQCADGAAARAFGSGHRRMRRIVCRARSDREGGILVIGKTDPAEFPARTHHERALSADSASSHDSGAAFF